SILGACAKHVFLVTDPKRLEATMRTAFDIARSGRPGPVVVDIPKDVQLAEDVFRGGGLLPMHGYQERSDSLKGATLSAADAQDFFRLLAASERPLIYAGGG